MPNFAKIYLIGHIGSIKVRTTSNGTEIVSFSLAVNRYIKKEKITDWYYVTTSQRWILDELSVGDLVFIEGIPQISEHNNQRYLNIWLNKIRILTRKGNNDENMEIEEPEITQSDEVPF